MSWKQKDVPRTARAFSQQEIKTQQIVGKSHDEESRLYNLTASKNTDAQWSFFKQWQESISKWPMIEKLSFWS